MVAKLKPVKLMAAAKKKVMKSSLVKKKKVQPKTKTVPPKAPAKKPEVHVHAFRPNNEIVPLTSFAAKCTAIPGVVNSTLTLGTAPGNRAMVIGTSTGITGMTYSVIQWDDASVARFVFTPPVFTVDGLNGGPTATKVMKHSIEVVSSTNALQREGNVRALQLNARLVLPNYPALLTSIELNTLFTKLFGLNDTINVGCEALTRPMVLSGIPADSSAYERFRGFTTPTTFDAYWALFAEWPALSNTADYQRPLSTQIWLFDTVTEQQTYTITGHMTSYCRYPIDTAAHLTSKDQPVVDAAAVAKSAMATVKQPIISIGVDRGATVITR
jgi:hypothetical protein